MREYNIVDFMAQQGIQKAIKIYGVEGTEQKIKSLYKLMPTLRDYMLKELWKKIRN